MKVRKFKSDEYNYLFDTTNGFFARWGKTADDDPSFSPYGPEILDIEVSTICHGINNKPCTHCYKSNTGNGKNMSIETFKSIIDKMPPLLTQVALGIGDINSNPDLFKMLEYCRSKNIIPNLTINGDRLTPRIVDSLISLCGAIAVSRYSPSDVCYDAVKLLTDKGLKQVNIHMMVSKETYPDCLQVIDDSKKDIRLSKLNAIVFLLMKPKGKRNNFGMIDWVSYKYLVDYAIDKKIRMGFDSCSAPIFMDCVKYHHDFDKYEMVCESCESSLFSSYINVDGRYFHCSFTEGEDGWNGIDVLNCKDFLKDVWFHEETNKFRNSLVNQKHSLSKTLRKCPIFNLDI